MKVIFCMELFVEAIYLRKSFFYFVTGVLILVVAYTVMGSILFMSIEGEIEESEKIETAVAASKPYPRNIDAISAELRLR